MHARYYGNAIGRFLSVDPVGGKIGSSQSWNRYSYVRNNPIRLMDPTGKAERVKPVKTPRAMTPHGAPITMYGRETKSNVSERPFLIDVVVGYFKRVLSQVPALSPPTYENLQTGSKSFGETAGSIIYDATKDIDSVIEAGGNIGHVTGGLAVINGDDRYGYVGATQSYGTKQIASFSLFVGVVKNYDGRGSYNGFFTTATTTSPLGATISMNPYDLNAPMAVGGTFTLGLGGPTVSGTTYLPIGDREATLR